MFLVSMIIARMRPSLFLLAGACLMAVAPAARPPDQASDQFESLAGLVRQRMSEYGVPGVVLGIVKNGQMNARGFGVTNIDEPQPITSETIFPLASISKTIATTAIMRLVEQGKIDLAAPVRKYLPDFRVQDETVSRD